MFYLYLLPILTVVFGIYFLIKLRFFFLFHPIRVGRRFLRALKDRSSRHAFSLALAGTLGVGNIVGVAYGISVGGAGSLFWMLISTVFSSVIKYCESSLGRELSGSGGLGMIGIIRKSFARLGVPLSYLYALLTLLLSFTMGSAMQGGAFKSCAELLFSDLTPYALIIYLFLLVAVMLFLRERITELTVRIIPVTTIIYILLSVAVLIRHASYLPSVLCRVISEAFEFSAIGGGVSAFFISKSIKEGFFRAILSNEAGTGSSALAESLSKATPGEVGLFGMAEVFFDTAILCTLTALSVLCIDAQGSEPLSGIAFAFSTVIPSFSTPLLFALIFLFSFSSLVCWLYYGERSYGYLFGARSSSPFYLLFVISLAFGFVLSESYLFPFVDSLLLFMSILSLFALKKNSERIIFLSERDGILPLYKSDS